MHVKSATWRNARLAAILVVGTCGSLVTQDRSGPRDEERSSLVGRVSDARGEVVANANVVLCSRPLSAVLDSGPLDIVEVRSDEQGRFRAALLVHRDYSVWATKNAGKSYRASEIIDGVRAPRTLRLVLDDEERWPTSVRFEGLDAWKARGPLRIYVLDPLPETMYRVPLEFDDQGRATLPLLAGTGAWVEVDDKDGKPIFQAHVAAPTSETPREATSAKVLRIAAPRKLRVQTRFAVVQGKPSQAACRDVRVWFGRNASRLPLIEVGKTNEDGVLDFELAFADHQARLQLDEAGVSRANTLEDCVLVVGGAETADAFASLSDVGGAPDADGTNQVRFELQLAARALGQVMIGEGQPAAHARLLVYNSLVGKTGSGGQCACAPRLFFCDADGRFEIPGRGTKDPFRVTWLPSEAQRRLLARDEFPVASEVIVAEGRWNEKGDIDFGIIDATKLVRLRVACTGIDGRPLVDGIVEIGERKQEGPNGPFRSRLDRRGQVCFLAPKDYPFGILLSSPRGFASTVGTAQKDLAVDLRLDGTRLFRGRIDGAASEGNRAWLNVQSFHGSAHAAPFDRWSTNMMLSGSSSPEFVDLRRIKDAGTQIRVRTWRYFGMPIPKLEIDGDGKFQVALPEPSLNLRFFACLTNDSGATSQQANIQPVEDFVELRFVK